MKPLPPRNHAKTRLLSAAIDSPAHQIVRPRGNVWDRLGKPRSEDDAEMRKKRNLHEDNFIDGQLPVSQDEEVQNPRSMPSKKNARLSNNLVEESIRLYDSCRKLASNNYSNEYRALEDNSKNVGDFADVNNSKRKRLLNEPNSVNSSVPFSGCKGIQLRGEETLQKMQNSFPMKHNQSRSFSKTASEAKDQRCLISDSTIIRSRMEQNSLADKVDAVIPENVAQNSYPCQLNRSSSNTQKQKLVPKNGQLQYKSETRSKAENCSANRRPVNDVRCMSHLT